MITYTKQFFPSNTHTTGGTLPNVHCEDLSNITGKGSDNETNKATISSNSGNNGQNGYALFKFNITAEELPTNVRISGVTCSVRGGTTNANVNGTIGLYSGSSITSGVGTAVNVTGLANGQTPTVSDITNCGTWIQSNLTGGTYVGALISMTKNRKQSCVMDFYGATLTVTYSKYFEVSATGTGCTLSHSGITEVDEGDSYSVTITPTVSSPYVITVKDNGNDVTDSLVGNTYTISNVSERHAITVQVEASTGSHTVGTSGTGCSISPSGNTAVSDGGSFTLSITPNFPKYTILLKDNGVDKSSSVTSDNKYVISRVREDHIIVVTVEEIPEYLYLKKNNNWNTSKTNYKKVNETWVPQEDFKEMFKEGLFVTKF